MSDSQAERIAKAIETAFDLSCGDFTEAISVLVHGEAWKMRHVFQSMADGMNWDVDDLIAELSSLVEHVIDGEL